MIKNDLITLFNRDLEKLKSQVLLFEREEDLWITKKEISNSPGNLCLHIIGNLNHFIGHVLGKTAYSRDRELEFTAKGISRTIIVKQIDETKRMVEQTLAAFDEDQLEENYPIKVFKELNSIGFFLIHLSTHLNYHLGQINYFRRLL